MWATVPSQAVPLDLFPDCILIHGQYPGLLGCDRTIQLGSMDHRTRGGWGLLHDMEDKLQLFARSVCKEEHNFGRFPATPQRFVKRSTGEGAYIVVRVG